MLFVQNGDLWVWENDRVRQLTQTNDLYQAVWSPNGQQIAAIQRALSVSDLVVLDADGTNLQQLTKNGPSKGDSFARAKDSIWALHPIWSTNGSEIFYLSQSGPPVGTPPVENPLAIYRIPASGGTRKVVFSPRRGNFGRLQLLKDGDFFLMYANGQIDTTTQVFRYNRTKGIMPIKGMLDASYDPALSPDGRWLAFAARVEKQHHVFVMSLLNGQITQVSTSGAARAPVWSPDGMQLAFLDSANNKRRFNLVVVDLTEQLGRVMISKTTNLTTDLQIDADSGVSWTR
jgi:TolB protein